MVNPLGFLSFLGGVVAGAGGSFGGKYLWRKYTKPELDIEHEVDSVAIRQDTGDALEMVVSVFKVSVTNSGETAAKNCRPRIHLRCSDLPSPVEQWWEPPDPDDLPEDVEPEDMAEPSMEGMELEVDTAVVWSEGSQQSRLTINPGETVTFDLLRIDQRDRNEEKSIQKVQFPSEQGWERTASFYSQIEHHEVLPRDPTAITKYQLANADWDISTIKVTCENAEMVQGQLQFNDELGWIQISVT